MFQKIVKRSIFLNDIDISDLAQKIYDIMGIVSQKPYLFNIPIIVNISLDKKYDNNILLDMLNRLNMGKFFSGKNDSLNTLIS